MAKPSLDWSSNVSKYRERKKSSRTRLNLPPPPLSLLLFGEIMSPGEIMSFGVSPVNYSDQFQTITSGAISLPTYLQVYLPALPFPSLPCPSLPCPALPYTTCPALPALHYLPCPVLPCPALPCLPTLPALPYPTLPYPTLPYPTLPCPALPCPALPYPKGLSLSTYLPTYPPHSGFDGFCQSVQCIIIKVIDTIPVINLVIDTIKCCIKLVIDTFYSPCLSCILLRS